MVVTILCRSTNYIFFVIYTDAPAASKEDSDKIDRVVSSIKVRSNSVGETASASQGTEYTFTCT